MAAVTEAARCYRRLSGTEFAPCDRNWKREGRLGQDHDRNALGRSAHKDGPAVATIDLDSRQKSLTHYVENRRDWAWRIGLALEIPNHFTIGRAEGVRIDQNEAAEFAALSKTVAAVQQGHDFLLIDTPPYDTYLMRLAHSMADTLVSPMNGRSRLGYG
jgi:cellulose biosynthesis protein BcsQ